MTDSPDQTPDHTPDPAARGSSVAETPDGPPRLHILLATLKCWEEAHVVPDPPAVGQLLGCNPAWVQAAFADPDFRRQLHLRGVPLTPATATSGQVLSSEQFVAIAMVTDPSRTGDLTRRLKAAKIPMQTWRNWMKQPAFARQYEAYAKLILDNALADVNLGLARAAARGDVSAIKFFYDVTGRSPLPASLQHAQSQTPQVDVQVLMMRMIELIQATVTDPHQVAAIAAGIEEIMPPTAG